LLLKESSEMAVSREEMATLAETQKRALRDRLPAA
jgi:hypothetical protein